jgi:hypothetical protein
MYPPWRRLQRVPVRPNLAIRAGGSRDVRSVNRFPGVFRAPRNPVRAGVRIFFCILISVTGALLLAAGIGQVMTYSKLQQSHLTVAGHMTCTPVIDFRTGRQNGEQDCNIDYSVDGVPYQIVAASVSTGEAYAANQLIYYSPASPGDAMTRSDFQDGPGASYKLIAIILVVIALAIGYGLWAAVTLSRM